jgi:hypothetical protein
METPRQQVDVPSLCASTARADGAHTQRFIMSCRIRQIVSSKMERVDRKTYVSHERNEVGRQVERLSAGASISEN